MSDKKISDIFDDDDIFDVESDDDDIDLSIFTEKEKTAEEKLDDLFTELAPADDEDLTADLPFGDTADDLSDFGDLAAELEAALGALPPEDEAKPEEPVVLPEEPVIFSGETEEIPTETDSAEETVEEPVVDAEEAAPAEPELSETEAAIEAFISSGTLEESGLFTESVDESEFAIPVYAAEESELPEEEEKIDESLSVPMEDVDSLDFEPADEPKVGSTDMNLRIAFGLEDGDEDPEKVNEAVKKLGDHLESNRRVHKKYVTTHAEFTDPIQAREIAAEYKKKKKNVSIRAFFCFIFALMLLVYENLPTITKLISGSPKQFAGALDPALYPVVYIMVSLQIMLICAVFALPELKHGILRLFTGSPTPESATCLMLAVGTVVSAVTAIKSTAMDVPTVYNAVPAFAVFMTLLYSRLNIRRENDTFYVAGSKKQKNVLERVPDSEVLMDVENYDDLYGDVMRIERTSFVSGFFQRMSVPDKMTSAFMTAIMCVAAAAAVVVGILSGRGGTPAVTVAKSVYVALLALLPMSTYLTFSYPFYRASIVACDLDCAIIGENSLDEYASSAVVTIDDDNLFPSFGVKVQNIRIYNNARIDRLLYYASSVFSKAGGPLADVFEVATMEMGRSDNVEIVDADRGYLASRADGVNIVFGGYLSLTSRGFDIPENVAQDDVDFWDELSIMYMFREDVLVAKMYIKYVLDGDMEPLVRQFDDYGMYLCVRTFDPNIDEEMIEGKLSMKKAPVKVVRYRSSDDVKSVSDSIDSGFVSTGSPKNLLHLIPYCDKTIHTKRTCIALTIMSMIISTMLLVIFGLSSSLGNINSLYIAAYNLVWLIPPFIASKLFIR